MNKRRIPGLFSSWLRLCAVACLLATAHAAEHHGRVTFNGMPVPGATVTASQGSKKVVAVSDVAGIYAFPDLADGTWELEVGMSGFEIAKQQVAVAANAQPAAAITAVIDFNITAPCSWFLLIVRLGAPVRSRCVSHHKKAYSMDRGSGIESAGMSPFGFYCCVLAVR